MHSVFVRKLNIFLRTALLFGLLNGLLFSCGEGIRLLPFPAPALVQNGESSLKDGGETDYQKNVLRFEKNETSKISKEQRGTKHLRAFFSKLTEPPTYRLKLFSQTVDLKNTESFDSQYRASALGSRAPPFS